MLKLNLIFADEIEATDEASVDIRIEDQSEADAPATRIASAKLDGLSIHEQSIHIETVLDLAADTVFDTVLGTALPENRNGLAIMVKVKCFDRNQEPVLYFNTESTPLLSSATSPDGIQADVILSRVL